MAKLLCVARWPDDSLDHPDYPIELDLQLQPVKTDGASIEWVICEARLCINPNVDGEKVTLLEQASSILKRDILRLVNELKDLLMQPRQDHLTFVPVTPSFEFSVLRLSDEQYRVIVWLDMAAEFNGASDIAYHGLRFTTNRARLMGFSRGLESELNTL